jgi:hypothetical protein
MLLQQVLHLLELILHIIGKPVFVVGSIHGERSCELLHKKQSITGYPG